jgi:uncharacterized protein (DUF1015 family)
MITARPFRALRYDPAAVDMDTVLAPPYDVIDDEERDQLYARSDYNAVRLILSKEHDRYAAAGRDLATWRGRGVLVRDEIPNFYLYAQEFAMPDGSMRERSGILASVRLEEFSAGNIMPHERTFPKAKADRMKIMEACRANLSPIFGIYPSADPSVAEVCARARRSAPWVDARDNREGRHRVWKIGDAESVAAMCAGFAQVKVFIADGHHRYETALEYRDRRRRDGGGDHESFNFVLMYLCPMDESGLVILPTHRLWCGGRGSAGGWLEKLKDAFAVEAVSVSGAPDLQRRLAAETGRGVMALRLRGESEAFLLRPRDWAAVERALSQVPPTLRELDVTVLDAFVFGQLLGVDYLADTEAGRVVYTHEDERAFAAVDSGDAEAAFQLRATRIEEVERICLAGEVMPQKSTYFHPKLQTGLVFHLLDDDE